jgi:hypothetical protein
MNGHKELAIRALENMRGDDAARARSEFRGLTTKQMQEQYGQSGKTRAQVLAKYEGHDAEVQAAIDWVKAQKG